MSLKDEFRLEAETGRGEGQVLGEGSVLDELREALCSFFVDYGAPDNLSEQAQTHNEALAVAIVRLDRFAAAHPSIIDLDRPETWPEEWIICRKTPIKAPEECPQCGWDMASRAHAGCCESPSRTKRKEATDD